MLKLTRRAKSASLPSKICGSHAFDLARRIEGPRSQKRSMKKKMKMAKSNKKKVSL